MNELILEMQETLVSTETSSYLVIIFLQSFPIFAIWGFDVCFKFILQAHSLRVATGRSQGS